MCRMNCSRACASFTTKKRSSNSPPSSPGRTRPASSTARCACRRSSCGRVRHGAQCFREFAHAVAQLSFIVTGVTEQESTAPAAFETKGRERLHVYTDGSGSPRGGCIVHARGQLADEVY